MSNTHSIRNNDPSTHEKTLDIREWIERLSCCAARSSYRDDVQSDCSCESPLYSLGDGSFAEEDGDGGLGRRVC